MCKFHAAFVGKCRLQNIEGSEFCENIARSGAVFAKNKRQMNVVMLDNSFVALRFVIIAKDTQIPAKGTVRLDS